MSAPAGADGAPVAAAAIAAAGTSAGRIVGEMTGSTRSNSASSTASTAPLDEPGHSDISLQKRAYFLYALTLFATVSVFAWAPRAAFRKAGDKDLEFEALDAVQELASLLFAVLYLVGVRRLRVKRREDERQKAKDLLGDRDLPGQYWSFQAFEHRINIVLLVGLGSGLPIVTDLIAYAIGGGDVSTALVFFPGGLRLLLLG